MGFNYTILYRAGKANLAADAFSRLLEPAPGQLLMLTIPNSLFCRN